MITVLKQLYQNSKQGLQDDQEEVTQKQLSKQPISNNSQNTTYVKQKQYVGMLLQKTSWLLKQELEEVNGLVEKRNNNVYIQICEGEIGITKEGINMQGSRMRQSKVISNQSHMKQLFQSQEDQETKAFQAKELIRRKQEEKAQRHAKLQKILEKQAETKRLKEQQEQKNRNSIVWMRNQKSIQKYRLVRERYSQEEIERQSKLSTIREFQERIQSISRVSQKDYVSLDVQRNREAQTSRTEILIQRKNQLKIDYKEIDEHGGKYLGKLRELESERLSRFQQRKSQDFNAMKLIKPFEEVYVPKDTFKQAQEKSNKIREFKQYVRQNVKPKVDFEKRRQLMNSIIAQDSSRYRSLGVMKSEVNGRIVEKELPKINLRSIGNEYMKYAKKLKSKLEHKAQTLEEEIQKPKMTNYLVDLKREERKRMSRSEEIEKSGAPLKEKMKRIHVSIECLENEIEKHKTLMRNSSGLGLGKVGELQEAIDTKNHEITNLKLTLMSLFQEQ